MLGSLDLPVRYLVFAATAIASTIDTGERISILAAVIGGQRRADALRTRTIMQCSSFDTPPLIRV